MTRRARPSADGSGIEIYDALEYGDGLETEVTHEVIQLLHDPERARQDAYAAHFPCRTLALVDYMVRYIAINYWRSPSYWGAKFAERVSYDPLSNRKYELLDASAVAMSFYSTLRAFYALLWNPEYSSSRYCVSVEAARSALQFAYPQGFIELPLENYERPAGISELEFRKAITDLTRPAIEPYNRAVQRIAEIVTANDYRSKQARELSKFRARANSVGSLINGLLNHHTRLTVVAVRFSIRQASTLDYLGERIQKAFEGLIGDRRNDIHLKNAIGYFWVRQESFRVSLQRRLTTIGAQSVDGGIALHYDLVLFFHVGRYREANAITEHLRERWGNATQDTGYCRSLSRKNVTPYLPRYIWERMEQTGVVPDDKDFVGVVTRNSSRARNLLKIAKTMVVSGALRKQKKQLASPTLIHNKARRFGKSDLLTGCGYTKEGRGAKQGKSGRKYERWQRP